MEDKFNLLNLEILLLDEKAFLAVCAVVSKYVADGDSNLVTNYMLLALAREILGNFDSQLLVDDKYFVDKLRRNYDTNHWYRCMIRTNKVFGMAIGSMYIRNVTTEDKDHENKLKDVKEIVTHIKQAYKYFIFNGTWIDNETRKRAFTKIDFMVDKIGYPVEIMNVTYRDELSSEFEMFYTWFYTFVESMKFVVHENLNKVWEPVNRKRWNLTPATVNAVHDLFFNDINIPMSLFQLPFYSPNRPTIMNYGGLGTIIGHEIMHAFGKSGSFHDEYGRYKHWLNVGTEIKLTSKSQCLIENYSKFNIKGYRGNSKFTNDEDISDTVGLRAAYYAYQLFKPKDKFDNETVWWMKTHRFNEDRLFFVAFAQNFCEKFTTDGLRSLVSTHSPGPFRIKGALSDSSYFKEVFSCTNYSPYVFRNRCHVW